MEKLIEILNEYEKSKDFRDYEWRIEKKSKERMCGTQIMGMSGEQFTGAYINDEEMERIIISKKYEFIKRLSDNDHIDRPKVWLRIKDLGDEYGWFAIYSGIHIECLLMLLSIQDKPIELLISILK